MILLGSLGINVKSQKTVSTFSVPIIRYSPVTVCPKNRTSAQDFGISAAATAVLSLLSPLLMGLIATCERIEFAGRSSIFC